MKIAFFTELYHPKISGVVENIETSAAALRAKGHEVFIIAPKTPGFKSKEKDVFWIPSIKLTSSAEFRVIVPLPDKTMRKLLGMDFDIVHAHAGGPASFLGWEVARRKKIPYVLTYHTLLNRYTHYVFNGKLITPKMAEIGTRVFGNLSNHIIAPTEGVRQELRSFGVKIPISVIPGGINLERFSLSKKGFLRKKYKISSDKVLLVYVGRLGKEKNLPFLLKSYSHVHKEGKNSVLFIVGDGSEKKKLEALAEKLAIKERVIFTGFIEPKDVNLVYADSDVFLFASQTETQGLVVAEAMASGLPVLVLKDTAFEKVVIDGETGLVAENSSDFTRKLEKLISDKNLRQELGQQARQLASSEFSDEKQAERLIEVYQKEIKNKLTSVDNQSWVRQITNLNAFLKLNQRLAQFKIITRLINGRNS